MFTIQSILYITDVELLSSNSPYSKNTTSFHLTLFRPISSIFKFDTSTTLSRSFMTRKRSTPPNQRTQTQGTVLHHCYTYFTRNNALIVNDYSIVLLLFDIILLWWLLQLKHSLYVFSTLRLPVSLLHVASVISTYSIIPFHYQILSFCWWDAFSLTF